VINWKHASFTAAMTFCAAMAGGCSAKGHYGLAGGWVLAMIIWQWLMHNEAAKGGRDE
jgi:hypothetical protein